MVCQGSASASVIASGMAITDYYLDRLLSEVALKLECPFHGTRDIQCRERIKMPIRTYLQRSQPTENYVHFLPHGLDGRIPRVNG